ncbi:cytochrome P450 315a1, mitochondrial [Thrips palmi]|uniref:Cytochrome P450 315a1, mitochondrial n=1 Tax=Thrips palmi TaxID=161013 RepID=A0A6P9A5Z3_THRPL|nr:cytochrome P450 315a1, mitochondrial [Thrips palmi]
MPQPRGPRTMGMPLPLFEGGHSKLHLYVDEQHRDLGDVFQDQIAPDSESIVFVADPVEMRRTFGLEGKYPLHLVPESWTVYNKAYGCQRGLFFMDGEEWLNMRRVMNRLMLKPEANIFSAPCQHVANALVSQWQHENTTEIQNLEEQLYKWSLDTVVAVMIGTNYEAHAGKWNGIISQLASDIHSIFLESAEMSSMSAKVARDEDKPVWRRFKKSVDVSLSTARSLLREMISVCSASPSGLLSDMQDAELSEEEIMKVVVDLILAAGDTTAMSLQWTLFLLAKNPDVQESISAKIRNKTDTLHPALLRGVVREALRLYPVAPFLIRIVPEQCVIGGYELPPNKLVFLSLYTSGRDPKNFPEPEKFWPERWLREISNDNENSSGAYIAVKNSYASMPFAMGARSCIGRKLAETQMITTLASILKQFKLELLNANDIEMVMRMVAVPSEPIRLRLKHHQ